MYVYLLLFLISVEFTVSLVTPMVSCAIRLDNLKLVYFVGQL